MSNGESASLCREIEAFLRKERCEPTAPESTMECARTYWRSRPTITTVEMEMLAWLGAAPQDIAAVACRLGRCPAETHQFLEALAASGLLVRSGDRYAVTSAMQAYLDSYLSL